MPSADRKKKTIQQTFHGLFIASGILALISPSMLVVHMFDLFEGTGVGLSTEAQLLFIGLTIVGIGGVFGVVSKGQLSQRIAAQLTAGLVIGFAILVASGLISALLILDWRVACSRGTGEACIAAAQSYSDEENTSTMDHYEQKACGLGSYRGCLAVAQRGSHTASKVICDNVRIHCIADQNMCARGVVDSCKSSLCFFLQSSCEH